MVQGQQTAEQQPQQQFQPQFDKKQTRDYINLYGKSPHSFNPELLNSVRQHAQHHNVPFYEGDFSIMEAIKHAGSGFIEGFTTLNLYKEQPDNQWEAIAKNIGHLVGFAPGIIASPLNKLGILTQSSKLLGIAAAIPKRGIPLAMAEDLVKPQAKKIVKSVMGKNLFPKNQALNTATDFLKTNLAKDVMSGAFTLGTASAISTWQHGTDAMMDSFFHGAIAGGGFKVIGNKIKLKDETATTFARGLSGSLFLGLPSTIRGATTPEQIYEYLLGAYFGGKELSWSQTKAREIHYKENIPFARQSQSARLDTTMDPTSMPSWKGQPREVKNELLILAEKETGLARGQDPRELEYALKEEFSEFQEALDKKTNISKGTKDNIKKEIKEEVKVEEVKEETVIKEIKNIEAKISELQKEENTPEIQRKIRELTEELDLFYKENIDKIKLYDDNGNIINTKKLNKDKFKELIKEGVKEGDVFWTEDGKFITVMKIKDGKVYATHDSGKDKDGNILYTEKGLGRTNIAESQAKSMDDFISKYFVGKQFRKVTNLSVDLKTGSGLVTEKKAPKVKETTTKKPIVKNKDKFILTSGSRGFDSILSEKAAQEGINTFQIKMPNQRGGKVGKGDEVVITPRNLDKQDKYVSSAIQDYNRRAEISRKTGADVRDFDVNSLRYGTTGNAYRALRRDAYRMRLADSIVIADAKINPTLDSLGLLQKINGQLAMNTGKPLYIINKQMGIVKWNPAKENSLTKEFGTFEIMDTIPELGDKIAFITPNTIDNRVMSIAHNMIEKQSFAANNKGQNIETIKKENNFDVDLSNFETGSTIEFELNSDLKNRLIYGLLNDKKFVADFPENIDRQNKLNEISDVATAISEQYINKSKQDLEMNEKGIFETRSTDFINEIQTKSNYKTLPEELKGSLRQWLVAKKYGKPISEISTDGQIGSIKLSSDLGKKGQNAPESPLEKEFNRYGKKGDDPVHTYLQRIDGIELTRYESTMANRLITEVDGLENYKYKTYEDAFAEASLRKRNAIINTVKEMKEKHDMHIWGGEGDKDKIVFVKYHPDLKKVKIPQEVKTKLSEINTKDALESLYKTTFADEIRGMQSNIAYHAAINNIPLSEASLFIGKDGYINNTVKLNKRLPVLMNTGWRGDKMFINNPREVGNLNLSEQGNYKAVIVRDSNKLVELVGAKNAELLQSTDGAILGENNTINAQQKDRGGSYQGQEKSVFFQDGIIAKYMSHKVLPDMAKMMREFKTNNPKLKDGINFIIYESSAKQLGKYKSGNYEIKNGKLELTEGAEVIEIDPGSFRYNYGVYDSVNSLGIKNGKHVGVPTPKQLNIMPHEHMLKAANSSVLNNWKKDLAESAFNGQESSNIELSEILKEKRNIPGTEEAFIREHFDTLGIRQIEKVLTTPGNESLANKMILEMINSSAKSISNLRMEAELGNLEGQMNNIADFRTAADNIIQHAASLGENQFPLYHGKYTRGIVQSAINKFIADKVFKPKLKNSLKGRMRPYDKALQEKFPEINNNDLSMKMHGVPSHELLVLGNLYKKLPFYDSVKRKESTLEDTLKASQAEKNAVKKAEYEELLTGLTVRVPQDAASGAQALKLIGFSGINDYGTLLHGRAMEMLGGADLDADSDFVFFGGRHSDGTGQGIRPEHMRMYKNQSEEFIHPETGKFVDVKDMFKKDIVLDVEKMVDQEAAKPQNKDLGLSKLENRMQLLFDMSQNEANTHPYMQFSPSIRGMVGQKTADSRQLMPSAVSLVQNARIAWSSVLGSGGEDVVETGTMTHKDVNGKKVKLPNPVAYRIVREAKGSEADKRKQIWLSSALVRYTADPANVLGLIDYNAMQVLLNKAYYGKKKTYVMEMNKGKTEFEEGIVPDSPLYTKMTLGMKKKYAPNVSKESRYDLISNLNSAFFGWDYKNNKSWSFDEVQGLLKNLERIPEEGRTSLLPHIANMLKPVDTRVTTFDRLNKAKFDKLISTHNKVVGNLGNQNRWKKLLDATTLKQSLIQKQINFVYANQLNNRWKREQLSEKPPKSIIKMFDKAKIEYNFHRIKEKDTQPEVLAKLENSLRTAEEFLDNSVWESASLNLILKQYQKSVKNNERIQADEMRKIQDFTEFVKNNDRKKQRQRSSEEPIHLTVDENNLTFGKSENPEVNEMISKLQQGKPAETKKADLTKTKGTSILDQIQTDMLIRQFKESLSSDYARDMLDFYMLGSLRSKRTNERQQKFFRLPKKNDLKQPALKALYKQGARANTTLTAFNSKEIGSKNVIEFLKEQGRLYTNPTTTTTNKNIPPKVKNHVKKYKESKVLKSMDFNEKIKEVKLSNAVSDIKENLKDLRKGNVSQEQREVVSELANLIKNDSHFDMNKFDKTIEMLYSYIDPMDPVMKPISQLNLKDYKNIIATYKQLKEGSMHKRWEKKLPLLKRLALKARNLMQFPLMVSNEQLAEAVVKVHKKKYQKSWDKGEPKEVDVLYPTSHGEIMQGQIHRVSSMQEAHSNRLVNDLTKKVRFLSQLPGNEGIDLHNIALAIRESRATYETPEIQQIYKDNLKRIQDGLSWNVLKNKEYVLDLGEKTRKTYNGKKIVEMVENIMENHYNSMDQLNRGVFETISNAEYSKIPKSEKYLWEKSGSNNWKKHPLAEYTLGFYDMDPGAATYKTHRILNINRFMTDLSKAYYKGPDKALEFAIHAGADGMRQLMNSMAIELMPITQYVKRVYNPSTKETIEKTISISKYKELKNKKGWLPDKDVNIKKLEKVIVPLTGKRKGYVPHYWPDNSGMKENLNKELAEVSKKYNDLLKNTEENTTEYTNGLNDYITEYKSLVNRYKFQTGDYEIGQQVDFQTALDAAMFPAMKDQLVASEQSRLNIQNLPSITSRSGSSKKREYHKTKWLMDPAIHSMYIQNTTRDLYGGLTNLLTRWTLNTMNKTNYKNIVENPKWYNSSTKTAKKGKEADFNEAKEVVKNWNYFWSDYVKQAQGMPTVVSEAAWNNPGLHLSTTPAGWFADNIAANNINKIGKALGLIKDGKLPKELQGLNNYDVQKLSNLEARFQLATLMTHPKTPINNIFGGSMHTWQSVGTDAVRKVYNYDYLQTLNPKLKTKEDVFKFLDEHGVQLEMAKSELGLDKSIRSLKNQDFVNELASKAKGNKEVTKEDLSYLKKKYKLTDKVVNLAGQFMTIPERHIRKDAWMSHYIKAYERLGGAITDPNSPILIEIANRGVKATQFLYSAPFRPGFARSGVGKVMSRFQLWAWNAVRFRNDVRKQAKRYGYKEGSPGMNKLKRMMTADIMVMALGSAFMYSMFEQTIPAPYSWFQDTADWFFGDEKTRERAFFGTYPGALAPLQMITPPLARFPISIVRELAEDDYTKLADYYMWTMFPFGRMGRDLFHPEQNIFKNPMRIPEKVFGFPMSGIAKESSSQLNSQSPPTPGSAFDLF